MSDIDLEHPALTPYVDGFAAVMRFGLRAGLAVIVLFLVVNVVGTVVAASSR